MRQFEFLQSQKSFRTASIVDHSFLVLFHQNALYLSLNGIESACFDLLGWAAIDLVSAVTCIDNFEFFNSCQRVLHFQQLL